MRLLAKIKHSHIFLSAAALALATGAAVFMIDGQPSSGSMHGSGTARCQDLLQPVELAYLPEAFSARLFPLSPFARSPLASRGLFSLQGYDVRSFADVLVIHEIDLRSGPDELTNVELASEAVDGHVIAPYDTFSFNSVVGERSADRGFRPGLMFSRGEVVTGVGGGVCIVSTAVYNAAVRAGYQVIERYPHSGCVRYAEPGLDAAVVYGCMDMRFKNNTGNAVLLRSKIVDDKLVVTLLGKKRPGLTVEIAREGFRELPFKIVTKEDPTVPEGTVQVKTPARTGFEATTIRVIKLGGKVIKREVLSVDHVPARDKIVLVPPKNIDEMDKPVDLKATEDATRVEASQPLTEPAKASDPPTWTMPTTQIEPELDVKLGTK